MDEYFNPARILELTKQLVRIPSITGSSAENKASAFIHAFFSGLAYYKNAPQNLMLFPVDAMGRLAVMAFVEAGQETSKTVLFNGHVDVVDTDVCGALSPVAFDADAYTQRIAAGNIPKDAAEDLQSGNWLFGRGVMDMKCGLALHMAYMASMSLRRRELKCNLLFLSVPDEEGDSAGMRGALPMLTAFIRERALDVLAALSGEPAFWGGGSGRNERIFFTGTTGKIMPLFFCVGREAHAGFCYDGLNAASIAAEIVAEVEGSPDFLDGAHGEVLPPPVCLKLKDLRDSYSVTLPEKAVAYFNVLTITRNPRDVLDLCKTAAQRALDSVIARQKASAAAFSARLKKAVDLPQWSGSVLLLEDLIGRADCHDKGKLACMQAMERYAAALPQRLDAREKGIALVDRLINEIGIKGPAVIISLLPPYYPHRINRRATDKERRLRAAMEKVCGEAQKTVGDVGLVECFTGIMDLSFMGFDGDRVALQAVADNMPGWGSIFSLPMDDLLSLDIPIASMGPSGKDAHKDTERLELDFSLHAAPAMLERLMQLLCEDA